MRSLAVTHKLDFITVVRHHRSNLIRRLLEELKAFEFPVFSVRMQIFKK